MFRIQHSGKPKTSRETKTIKNRLIEKLLSKNTIGKMRGNREARQIANYRAEEERIHRQMQDHAERKKRDKKIEERTKTPTAQGRRDEWRREKREERKMARREYGKRNQNANKTCYWGEEKEKKHQERWREITRKEEGRRSARERPERGKTAPARLQNEGQK